MPCSPSTITGSRSVVSSSRPSRLTTVGRFRPRTMIVVWVVSPPASSANPTTFSRAKRTASVGVELAADDHDVALDLGELVVGDPGQAAQQIVGDVAQIVAALAQVHALDLGEAPLVLLGGAQDRPLGVHLTVDDGLDRCGGRRRGRRAASPAPRGCRRCPRPGSRPSCAAPSPARRWRERRASSKRWISASIWSSSRWKRRT